jgi:cytochrome c-type biogenesis protein CcmH
MILALMLLLQLQVPDAAQFVGPPKGQPLTGDSLFHRTNEVGELLRCPVCQGMSVADSPAEMAVNMKGQVRELLARGYTEEQILEYFEKSYGQFVLLKPKSPMVWLLPVIALVLGVIVVYFKLKNLKGPPDPPQPPAPPTGDDPYLERVRDLVGGEKS